MFTIEDDIKEYVKSMFERYERSDIRAAKVIHGPIHGSNLFDPWEISLIDSPFCQRLRYISQTDIASLVYPSANMNRLEHSLGVAVIANQILEALRKRSPKLITREVAMEVRIAALLHDIGHGPFSHLSEDIFKDFPEVKEYQAQNPGKFNPDKPTEMLAYLILNSSQFKDFFDNEIIKQHGLPDIKLERIAEMIIGQMSELQKNGWMGNIINGPFDADKLDYIQRDSYFAGLRSGLDVDRLLQTIWIDLKERQCIKVMASGVVTLEQILFNKIMSYTKIYHHHKVRAVGCHIKGIFEMILDNSTSPFTIVGKDMKNVTDFLSVVDMDVLYTFDKPPEIKEYIQRFLDRKVFKRALVISMATIKNPEDTPGYSDFKSLADKPAEIENLRKLIVNALKDKRSVYDIWLDLPVSPYVLKESAQTKIQDPGGKSRSLLKYFPAKNWLTSYESVKWQGHVFCPPDKEIRKEVGKKAAEVLGDIFGISFNERAYEEAKIDC